ncbi:S8 family serine peptidase [Isoptericola aurantiacus]|uniref:S8 family serine peptidase n=1 Tax=Isoptericola aurantiacus TaxID=3377839 RepID=UPI00383B7951
MTHDDVERPAHGPQGPGAGARELIVMTEPRERVRVTARGVESSTADAGGLQEILARHDATLAPLFGDESVVEAEVAAMPDRSDAVAQLPTYYHVEAPDDRLEALADELSQDPLVAAAYVKPAAEPPVLAVDDLDAVMSETPDPGSPPAVTPDFTGRQGYLDPAPGGIDARYAWTLGGGRGAGIRVIDCEWGWRFTHEDLGVHQGGVVAGTGGTDTDHGTAVLGEISGDRNSLGITGIAPDAVISASAFSVPSATAIRSAANRLRAGDVLLLEIHRPGPNAPMPRQGQQGFIAIEWWPDDYAAIRYAVEKGIVVVEAAGNGSEDFDDAAYDRRPRGFPSGWTNPFDPANPTSGAVVVGAGAPPPGTHDRNHGPDRSRLGFSNWGRRVDVQGWGREVTSTGYGGLQGGTDPDRHYTDTFSGTSSASPIVVGAIAAVQGVLRARNRPLLSPARAIELLRSTGSPQTDAPGRPRTQRIGNRPDLRELIRAALATRSPWVGVQFHGRLGPRQTRCWFTFNWPAHWHVVWTVVPTTVRPGAPQLQWRTQVERAQDGRATYWICVTNLTGTTVDLEGRYGVLGW